MRINGTYLICIVGALLLFGGMAAGDSANLLYPALMMLTGGGILIKFAPRC